MTTILGLSAFYHDSAAALVRDGQVLAAAQEERFSRRKHDAAFPRQAVQYCLEEAGLTVEQLDYVGFYDKPLRKFERLLETHLAFAPCGYAGFLAAMPDWMKRKLYLPRQIRQGLPGRFARRLVFAEHHESHAASAFYPSPFDQAAILTADGVGEWATTTWGIGQGNRIQLCEELRFPHSPGLLYSAFTAFCGFRVNSGEYKLMGLSPYGEPRYVETILREIVDLKADGSFRLNQDCFRYCQGRTMTSKRFERLFGGPGRTADQPLCSREMDLAASIQQVVEEILLRMARHVQARTRQQDLCLAGGVALNCVANGRLLRETPFQRIWVQPAAGDAGGALGVALLIAHQLLNQTRTASADVQHGSRFGPEYSPDQIARALDRRRAVYQRVADEGELCRQTASLLAEGNVVGWFQGRLEFGPRALGGRSILGDPRDPGMQSRMNQKIKFRESFRPFAPAILREQVHCYYDVPEGWDSPYMLFTAPLLERHRPPASGPGPVEPPADTVRRLSVPRGPLPAVTHVDYSARIQTVDPRDGRFYHLLQHFHQRTGMPALINTSFNVRGEPIVCTPDQAYDGFMATDMDALVIGDFVLTKDEQPVENRIRSERHAGRFERD